VTVESQGSRADRRRWFDDLDSHECWVCQSKNDIQIHHIERRSQAPKRYDVPENLFLVCGDCHTAKFHNRSHAWQLAVKLVWDSENFDLEKWLRIRDPELRSPDRVTLVDIAVWLHARAWYNK